MQTNKHVMVTVNGEMPVRSNGRGVYSLTEKLSFQASTLDDASHPVSLRNLANAEKQLGEVCKWIYAGKTEVTHVHF